jgi:predicted Rossmann-fold nucleotide-binding protein
VQTGKIRDFPVILMGKDYWEPLMVFIRERLLREKTVNPQDLGLLLITDSPEEAVDHIADRVVNKFGFNWSKPKRRWWLGE